MSKANQVQAAREKLKLVTEHLIKLGARGMESVEDPLGIVVDRWLLPGGRGNIVVMATPLWWNVFTDVVQSNSVAATLDAITKLAEGQ